MIRPPRVVDFSTHVSGPLAASLLGQLGAVVVKVENPRTGDGNRTVAPYVDGIGLLHLALNVGARSLAVSRHSRHWPTVVEACARWADVVLVGMRPKDAAPMGIDFASLTAANPSLIYCSITGYGEKGPWSEHTGHGINFDARAGQLPVEITDTRALMRPEYTVPVGTTVAGMLGALGVFAALNRRQEGVPQLVEVSLWHAALWWNFRSLTSIANLGLPLPPYSDFGSRYALYRTSDARAILVAPIERKFWEEFCAVVGLPDGAETKGDWRSGFDWGSGDEAERRQIGDLIGARTLNEWTSAFDQTRVPFSPVLSAEEALASDQAAGEQVLETLSDGHSVPRVAVSITDGPDSERPSEGRPPPPGLGQHSADVLAEIGLGELVGELRQGSLTA